MRYLRPTQLEEAATLVAGGAIVLAGGTVVVAGLSQRLPDEVGTVIDLSSIAQLRTFEGKADEYRLGAMLSLTQLLNVPLADGEAALAEAVAAVGNPTIRGMATLGGNVALPGRDLHPALLVLDARLELAGEPHPIPMHGAGLSPDSLLTHVLVPRRPGRRSTFIKQAFRQSSALTVVAVAVAIELEGSVIRRPRLAVLGVGTFAQRLPGAEALLEGQEVSASLVERVGGCAAAEAKAASHQGVSEVFRRQLAEVAFARALSKVCGS